MAVFEYDGEPLVVTGGEDRALRSWRLDGRPGPFELPEAHSGAITALVVVEYGGEPLIISGGDDRYSAAGDSTGGPVDFSSRIPTMARSPRWLASSTGGEPLIISGGDDGALRSWRLDRSRGALQQPEAHDAYSGVAALGGRRRR